MSALTPEAVAACSNCEGSGWVCEDHPDRPWEGTSAPGEGCDCGAGSPCPCCNLRMAAVGLTEPLRELVVRAISMLESAERETNWGTPCFGPTPSEVIQNDLDALLQADPQP
jgi:hypothetical protein